MKILIFSPAISGHNIEYLDYIYKRIVNSKINVVFLIPLKIPETEILTPSEQIKILYLDQEYSNFSKNKKAEIINSYCLKEAIDHILFMHLDILLIPEFVKINKKTHVSAIYFEHFIRYKLFTEFRFWARGLRYISKIVSNKSVKNIFILNDSSGVRFLNTIYFFIPKFKYLSDPIDFSQRFDHQSVKKIRTTTYKIYCIGSLHDRKNTVGVIKALKYLPDNLLAKIELIIIGNTPQDEATRIKQEITSILKHNPNAKINFQNKILDKEEFEILLAQADFLAIPYIGHVGSSGILGNAVKFQKLVIGSNRGLVGKFIKKYNLGVTVDEHNPQDIARGIIHLVSNHNSPPKFDQYIKDLQPFPESFSNILINNIKSTKSNIN